MSFSSAQGFLSEDVLRSMLMEQLRNERLNTAGQQANQALQAGIGGGLQMHQQQQQAEESNRRWEAENARAQGNHDQELADLQDQAGLRKRQESERRAEMAVPGALAAAQASKDQWGGPDGNAQFFAPEDRQAPDYQGQELQALAGQLGLSPEWLQGKASDIQRQRSGEDVAARQQQATHAGELAKLEAELEGSRAQTSQADAVTGTIAETGAYPSRRVEQDNTVTRQGKFFPPAARGGGGGFGGGGGIEPSRLLETLRKRAADARVRLNAIDQRIAPEEYKRQIQAVTQAEGHYEQLRSQVQGGPAEGDRGPAPGGVAADPGFMGQVQKAVRSLVEDGVEPENIQKFIDEGRQKGRSDQDIYQSLVLAAHAGALAP